MSDSADFSVVQDYSYGVASTHYRVGPTDMKLYADSLLITSGVIFESGNPWGRGVFMMFDKDNFSIIHDHMRFAIAGGTVFYYPAAFDISETKNVLISASPAVL